MGNAEEAGRLTAGAGTLTTNDNLLVEGEPNIRASVPGPAAGVALPPTVGAAQRQSLPVRGHTRDPPQLERTGPSQRERERSFRLRNLSRPRGEAAVRADQQRAR